MGDWQLTATTGYCDAVDEEVTIIVSKDWSARCVSYKKYYQPGRDTRKLMEQKARTLNRKISCEGLDCPRVTHYKDKLYAEEARKQAAGQESKGT